MKRLIFIFIVLFSFNALSQKGKIIGVLATSEQNLNLGGTRIKLLQNNSIIKETIANDLGHFALSDISNETYSLQIYQIGFRTYTVDSLKISQDSTLQLTIKYPPDCLFNYPEKYKPKCIGGHTNGIIPIVYGLPNQKTMKKASNGFVHLGGCIVTDCDPKYFCTIKKNFDLKQG